MGWFRTKQKVKRVRYNTSNFVEKVLRKVLFLGRSDEWDWMEKVEGTDYYSLNGEKLDERLENSHIRFHGKPRREHYLDKALRFVFYTWYEPIFTFKRWCRSKLDWFLFFRAREISWKTHHYIHKSGTSHIDGYFEFKVFGIRGTRTMDLCGIGGLKGDMTGYDMEKRKAHNRLNYIDLNKYGSWGFPTLLVNRPKVKPGDIDKILNKWYDEQVEYKYRHWTWKGERPKITVDDLKFMEDLCLDCGRDKEEDGCSCEVV